MNYRPSFKIPNARLDPWALALLHMVIAASAMMRGMTMKTRELGGKWEDLWQVIPTADLSWSSVWFLHAQPPGYSLWGWFWLKIAPTFYQEAIQAAHIGLAMITIAMIYSLARAMTGSRRTALVAGLIVALNPAMFYFEAYLLYEMLVVTLVTASAWFLERSLRLRQARWLVGMIVVLDLLVLTRSLYHIVFLVAALALAWPAWKRLGAVRALALFLAALMLPFGWYAKNYAQYGFFGSSSWFGMGLVRCVVKGYTSQELVKLADSGEISQITAQRWPYDHLPGDYVQFGFTKTSNISFLNHENLHNINIPDISRQYAADSFKLIRTNPDRYFISLSRAYKEICRPVSRFRHLVVHQVDYICWELIYSQIFYGQMITDTFVTFRGESADIGSLYFFYFPILMIWATAWTAMRTIGNRRRAAAGLPVEPADAAAPWVMGYIVMVTLYVMAVGTLFEFGENERFRFGIEQLDYLMVMILIRSAWLRMQASAARPPRAGQASGRKSPAQ